MSASPRHAELRRSYVVILDGPSSDCLLDICLVAGSGDAGAAAEEILERLTSMVPYAGAALCAWDPILEHHLAIANAGYPGEVLRYLNDGFVARDPAYQLMLTSEPYPLRWRDTPFDYRCTFSAQEVFGPAGYDEGMSASLYRPDGRYTGAFHVSTEGCRHPSDVGREVIHRLRPVMAVVVDRLRTPARIAHCLDPTAHAGAVTLRGDVLTLPGRTAGPLLVRDSPLVSRAVALMLANSDERRFVWQAPDHEWHRVRLVPLDHGAVLTEERAPLPHRLTARELEVLTLVAAGHSNAEIGRTLVIAPRTVATHVEHVFEKLHCHSRAASAAIATAEGLLLER